MKNKKYIIILISMFIFLFSSYKRVEGLNNYFSLVSINGNIDTEENILIVTESINGNYNYTLGRLITGDFTIEYNAPAYEIEEDITWLAYAGNDLYEFGSDSDPWENPDYQIAYKIIVYYANATFYGYLGTNNEYHYYDQNGNEFLWMPSSMNCNNFISNNPRNYNDTHTIIGYNSINSTRYSNYNYFFDNLKTNYGHNYYGSCGFVSAASLLTYYDFFYNNNFINDTSTYHNNYCYNSEFIAKSSSSVFSTSEFYISPGYCDSFQYYLIDEIVIQNLNYSFQLDESNNPVYASTGTMIKQTIENYIENETNISSNDYSVILLNNDTAIKNEIDNGRPVELSIVNYEYENNSDIFIKFNAPHSVIAYGYKTLSNGETIYLCHYGGISLKSLWIKPLDNYINGLTIIYTGNTNNCNDNVYKYNHDENCNGFYLCHKHSGYVYYLDRTMVCSSYDNYFCPTCNSFIMQGAHIHNKTNIWHNYYNHLTTCPCGYSSYEGHIVTGNPLPNGYYICIECGGYARMGIIPRNIKILSDDGSFITSENIMYINNDNE